MSEVKRLSLDLEYPFQYREDSEGTLCYYADYAALKEQFDFKQNLTEQVVALQKQCEALAAENAMLKSAIVIAKDDLQEHYDTDGVDSQDSEGNFMDACVRLCDAQCTIEKLENIAIPATDAYLNSVRAEGVDYVAEAIGAKCAELKVGTKDWKSLKSIVFMLGDFSAKLRAGKDGE